MRACPPQLPSFLQNRPHSLASVWPPLPILPVLSFAAPSFPSSRKKDDGWRFFFFNIRGELERAESSRALSSPRPPPASLFRCPLHIKTEKKERSSSLKCVPREGRTPGSLLEKGPSKETDCLLLLLLPHREEYAIGSPAPLSAAGVTRGSHWRSGHWPSEGFLPWCIEPSRGSILFSTVLRAPGSASLHTGCHVTPPAWKRSIRRTGSFVLSSGPAAPTASLPPSI